MLARLAYIVLFLVSTVSFAQVKFEAKVSKSKLGINERLRVDFEMNQSGDNFESPSFSDFTVVGGPNLSESTSYFNGKRSYTKTYTYFLSPNAKGQFKIGSASIDIGGKTYKTQPVTVTVTNAVAPPKNSAAATAQTIAEENIHLVAEVSNPNPYLNEAITVLYKLYVSPSTGVSNWREKENPRFNDFWSQNIEIKAYKQENGKFNGEDYRYVVLKKVVLYPQKTGKLKLEPFVLDLTVEVPKRGYDIFGNQLMTRVPQTIRAGNRTINVKPLPETGKPVNFSGAVGDFDFTVTTTKTALNASESLEAKVQVSGKGNLKLFELPKLNVPSSLEVYEPEHTENVRTNLSGMQGRISDTYTIVPQYKGKYPIPNIEFSYFDLKTESYKTINSEELLIDVITGPSNTESTVAKTTVAQTNTPNAPFAFIKTSTDFKPIATTPFFKSTGFWTSLLAPLLAIPIAILVRRKKDERDADVVGNKRRKADRLARKYLSTAKKALGDKVPFYLSLEKALHNYLKAKLKIETSDMSKPKIKELLASRQVDESNVDSFLKLLESCELARYAPSTTVEMQRDYDNAATTISQIDKQIR